MQFRVPQFIDLEDKIIGPFTLKQFGYTLGAAGFAFVLWTLIPIKIIALILIIPVAGLFLALAFIKINNRPFGEILESAFGYYTSSKLYTWKQPTVEQGVPQQNVPAEKMLNETAKDIAVAKADQAKLHELSLGLDVLDKNTPPPIQTPTQSAA